jgi:hypothetical protein
VGKHQTPVVEIVSGAGYIVTNKGPVILIKHQMGNIRNGPTIHSCGEMEAFGHQVCDKSVHVGGKQRILTADGYVIPIAIIHGLPRIKMHPPSQQEMASLPHVILTQPEGEGQWDPSILDFDLEESGEQWFDAVEHMEQYPCSTLFDEFGNYRRRVVAELHHVLFNNCDPSLDALDHAIFHAHYSNIGQPSDHYIFHDEYSDQPHDADTDDDDLPTISPGHESSSDDDDVHNPNPEVPLLLPVFVLSPLHVRKHIPQHGNIVASHVMAPLPKLHLMILLLRLSRTS